MAQLESLIVLGSVPRSRAALAFGFERAGFSVYATDQGADAMFMAQTQAAQLLIASSEALLTDGSSVLRLLERLRGQTATRDLPIVVTGDPHQRDEAIRSGADEFVPRPAFIRDVVTLAKVAVTRRQGGDPESVSGLLDEYGLYFLTRALSVAKRSGVLEISRGRRVGEVHFANGEVVSARSGRLLGVNAFFHLLLWDEAALQLRFHGVQVVTRRQIMVGVDELLDGGAKFAREFERLSAQVGGVRALHKQDLRRSSELRAEIPADVFKLLRFYDGRRSLIDVVEDSPFRPFDTIKITHRLTELGVIEQLASSAQASPLTAELAVRDWLLGATSDSDAPTVTEVGRRAVEAIAKAKAERSPEPPPVQPDDELLSISMTADLPPLPSDEKANLDGVVSGTIQVQSRSLAHPEVHTQTVFHQEVAPTLGVREEAPAPPAVTRFMDAPSAAPERPRSIKKPPPAKNIPIVRAPAAKAPVSKVPPSLPFSKEEEEFFAREKELQKVEPVENFDDLDSRPRAKISKRPWQIFGERLAPTSTSQPRPKK